MVNYTTPSHGYHLSCKTSYNLHLSDLIGTDSLYDCSAEWSGPSGVSCCLVLCLFGWNGRKYSFPTGHMTMVYTPRCGIM